MWSNWGRERAGHLRSMIEAFSNLRPILLKENGIIERVGSNKNGGWKVTLK